MTISVEIKKLRQKAFLSQEKFAKAVGVSAPTVNRWETGAYKPNYSAMKKLKDYCSVNDLSFEDLENEWLKLEKGGDVK